jgi:branched-chain amino acid transport system permease protein
MMSRAFWFHALILAAIFGLSLILPTYHFGQLSRILVLAVYAMGYNILFGYTGLLSLGHAMFFAAGMYGMGLTAQHLNFELLPAYGAGLLAALALAFVVGLLALRTIGVAFMIVTLMFAQAGYLLILYFGDWTRADEGFNTPQAARQFMQFDFSQADMRFYAAFGLFVLALLVNYILVRSSFGRALIAVRENEARAQLLGYNVWRYKYTALVLSGVYSGAAGAAYGVLFGYVGASFAAVAYSIFPLLWVLVGGVGTLLGPLVGTAFMVYLIDYASGLTDAYMLVVGVVLIFMVLFARRGFMGLVRRYALPWLP